MTYPLPNTHAEALLVFIRANPGASKAALCRGAALDVSDVSRILPKLVAHGLVRIETDQRGYHAVWPIA